MVRMLIVIMRRLHVNYPFVISTLSQKPCLYYIIKPYVKQKQRTLTLLQCTGTIRSLYKQTVKLAMLALQRPLRGIC